MTDSKWHFDKTISIGHIIIVIAISVFSWIMAVDKRVEHNAQEIRFLTQIDKRIEQRVDNTRKVVERIRNEIKQDLKGINTKLDRLIERQISKP